MNTQNEISNEEIELPLRSTKVFSGGSGALEFNNNWTTWKDQHHNNFETSRGVYHCFDQTLDNITDKRTGGFGQIIGLYRVRNAQIFGTIKGKKRYIYGKETTNDINCSNIEWRNQNFERVNSETLDLIEGAQRQPS